MTDFLSDVENTVDLSSHETLKSQMRNLKELQQNWLKDMVRSTYMLYAFVNVVVLYVLSQETVDNEEVEKAKDILSHMVSELKPTGPKAPTILITDTGPETPKDAMLTVEIPKISVSSEEEVFSSQQSHEGSKRPSSLVAVVRPMQASASGSTKSGLSSGEEEIFTLDTLPSPNDIQRSGSIVGEPQLPVPTEFRDMQDSDDEEVTF